MKARALIFDFDSTLVDFHAGDDAAIRRVIGLSGCTAAFEEFQDHSVSVLYGVYERGVDHGGDIHRYRLRETLAHFGTAWDEAYRQAYLDIYLRLVPVFPGVKEALALLRQAGVRLGLLTNSIDPVEQGQRIDSSGLRPFFDRVLIAAEIGVWKPDPEAFRIAADSLACRVEDCIFVGDSERHDIGGAKAAGMVAIKRTKGEAGHGRPAASPSAADASFSDYAGLPAILREKFGIC
jgi:putative hydrolase of the HAD superfamily